MPRIKVAGMCPVCNKEMWKTSIRKHRISVHKESVPEAKPKFIVTDVSIKEAIPFSYIDEKDETLILLNKIEGCKKDFNGTKSAMQLYFSFKECELLIECVKCVLQKKEKELIQTV